MDNLIKSIVEKLDIYDKNVLDDIFKNPTLTNLFLKNNDLMKILFDYIVTTKNKEFYELIDYLKEHNDQIIERFNMFKFNNGEFTKIDLKTLQKSDEGQKILNTILLFNTKQTNNLNFNKIFDKIKNSDIQSFKFNDLFDDVLLNNIHQNYMFDFMGKYEKTDDLIKDYKVEDIKNNNEKITFKYLDLMENYILKYNDNSKVFKMWFYILLSYIYDKPNLKFIDLLNIFQNFNILFYNKLITPNDKDANLITYLYFKNNDHYKPNLRYTIDIKGEDIKNKIEYLKTYKSPTFDEFKTTIEENETGFYFNTLQYKPNEIINKCQQYMNNKKYNELIYYIFNSQFLNRSTCLFGYFVYFYTTHRILKNSYYHDIIALTRPFNEFDEIINNNNINITEFEKISKISLNNIIDFIN